MKFRELWYVNLIEGKFSKTEPIRWLHQIIVISL